MDDNPFKAFAAGGSGAGARSGRRGGGGGGGGGGGWMTSRRPGRDDDAIARAKAEATEARRARSRRGGAAAKKAAAKKPRSKSSSAAGGGGANKRRRRKDDFIDDSDEESFRGYSEEEDDDDEDSFIAHDDEEEDEAMVLDSDDEEEEGDWDSDMEDSDEDFGGKKKKKKSKSKANDAKSTAKSKARSHAEKAPTRRTARGSSWKPPTASSQNSVEEIEESPVPPGRGGGRAASAAASKKRAVEESPISLDGDSEADDDDIYEEKGPSKQAAGRANKASKYFSSRKGDPEFEDEKKEEEEDDCVPSRAARNGGGKTAKKKRKILDDSDDDSDEDDAWAGAGPFSEPAAADDGPLDDTPRKRSIDEDDFVDDDEALAMRQAMKASLEDSSAEKEPKKKRIKKSGKKKKKGRSSLEDIRRASPPKNKPVYKDDVEDLRDSDDDEDPQEDDEVEVYEAAVDEEEQTAAQVLAEANALSSRIVGIVSGWCGGHLDGVGDNVKGMILGEDENEGALALGAGPGENNAADDTWITNETMREIMPDAKLAEYQLLGVNWMALLNRTTFGKGGGGGKKGKKKGGMNVNGILADEMGLGKTVQTIAFLAWLNHQNKAKDDGDGDDKRRPHIIVVPASVLSNWMIEFKKFAPDMTVVKYHGSQAEREGIKGELTTRYINGGERLDALLTTFSYFSSDSNKGDRSFLRKFQFDYLVVDEGHTLKNPKGLRYQNLNKFQTSHRLLLTGTPVQNSPKELMSLLCFLMPLFDSKTKSKRKKGYDNDSDDENDGGERMLEYFVHLEGGGSVSDAEAYRKLKQLFAPFVLRRKKVEVLGQILPPKTRKVEIVPMDEATRSSYESIISDHVKARADKASGSGGAAAQKHLFTALRKAANHPLLLRNRFKSDEEKDNLARLALDYGWFGNDASCTLQLVKNELDKYSDYEVHSAALHMIEESHARRKYLEKYTLLEEDLFCSPKFVRLRTLLPELIGKGHRLLIFSQWTKVLDLMGLLMESLQLQFLRLDGSTVVSERQDLIDTFNNDSEIPVFLLSTRAGGMGLNLTAADVCILHDLDFNPFNDLQAEDRCYRIGQKKPVTIIKMVTQGTVDEDIYSIQERKARMNKAIMEEGGNKSKKSNESNEMSRLANAAVERFLKSPPKPSASASTSAIVSREGSDLDPAPTDSSGEKKPVSLFKDAAPKKVTCIDLGDSDSD